MDLKPINHNDKKITLIMEDINPYQIGLLTEALGKLVIRSGIVSDGAILSFPQLMMLVDDVLHVDKELPKFEYDIDDVKTKLNSTASYFKEGTWIKRRRNPDGALAVKVIDHLVSKIP
jgi:hypothetical protein